MVRFEGHEQLALRVLSLSDADALANRLDLPAVDLVVATLAHQSASPHEVEARLRTLGRPTLLRIAKTWATEPKNLSANPSEIRGFDDFKRLAVAKTEEWQRPIQELGKRLAAQFASHRAIIRESLRVQEQLQRIAATATVVNRAADSLREVGASFARSLRLALPDPEVFAEAFREADEGKRFLDIHGYGFAIGDWGISTLRQIARDKPDSRELHRAFLSLTRSHSFSERFLRHFEADGRLRRRYSVMAAALEAHVARSYALSVPVLYAQLEGVLTDLLVSEGLARQRCARAYKAKGKELRGLRSKARRYGERETILREFVTAGVLEEISPDRNAVLHGMKVGYTQAHRSARLLLLVDILAATVVRGERAQPKIEA